MEGMETVNKIIFIGGDMRQIRAINQISRSKTAVEVLGFESETEKLFDPSVTVVYDISKLSENCRAAVLPLPYTTDGENINMPYSENKISVSEVMREMPKPRCILAGRCDEKLKTLAEVYGVPLTDYFCREELMILNAIPTAEGAIQIAMEETPHTINRSRCLVIGYGRIGKILSEMLRGLGAEVTAAARKRKDLALAGAFGCNTVPIWELHEIIGEFDIVFNTVPSMLLDFDMMSKIPKRTLLIDLASRPGGIDFDAAQDLGLRAIRALSLPGKVAPDTAGDIIKDTILNILEEMEV